MNLRDDSTSEEIRFAVLTHTLQGSSAPLEGTDEKSGAWELRRAIDRERVRQDRPVKLDLAAVTFIDSEALGMILSHHRSMARKNLSLKILKASPRLHRQLQALQLDFLMEGGPEEKPRDP